MKTLSRNIKNDLYIEKGGLALSEDAEAKCDIIESIILTQQGELQFDPEGGVDYFGSVFQSARYIDLWAAQVRSIVEALEWVQSIEDFQYRFDAPSSSLYWSMQVMSVDGERLDLKSKKKKSDDTLEVRIKWDTIYNKENIDSANEAMRKMRDARNSPPYKNMDGLDGRATLLSLKNAINDIVLLPNGSGDHNSADDIRLYLAGMDRDTTVVLSNVTSDGEWTVYWGDGTDSHCAPGESPRHVYAAGGDAELVLVGDITAIGAESSSRADSSSSSFVNVPERVIGFLAGSETSLERLGADTFAGCANLVAVAIGAQVNYIGAHCFDGCVRLPDIKWMPKTVQELGAYAFKDCTALESLDGLQKTGTGLTAIPEGCFSGCSGLQSAAHFPSDIGSIGDEAFSGCTSLSTVFVRSAVTAIGENAFPSDSIVNVRWDASPSVSMGDGNFPQKGLSLNLYVMDGNAEFFHDWGENLVHEYGEMNFYHGTENMPSVRVGGTSRVQSDCVWTVENGDAEEDIMLPWETAIPPHVYTSMGGELVVSIKGYVTRLEAASVSAFPLLSFDRPGNNPWLAKVTLSDAMADSLSAIGTACFCTCTGLAEISDSATGSYGKIAIGGENAFSKCSGLTNLGFVDSFEEGAAYCFAECDNLNATNAMWTGAGENITMIPQGCFANCANVTLQYAPDTIQVIKPYAFFSSGITSLAEFPAAVTELGEGCFMQCEKLTTISGLADAQGLKSLPSLCFSECSNLQSLDGLSNISHIGSECFYNCEKISSLEGLMSAVPQSHDDWMVIEDSAFAYSGVTDTSYLPIATAKLGNFVFDGTNMSRVVITATEPAEITMDTFSGILPPSPESGESSSGSSSSSSDVPEYEDDVPIYVRPGYLGVFKAAPVWSSLDILENGITLTYLKPPSGDSLSIGAIGSQYLGIMTVIWGERGRVETYADGQQTEETDLVFQKASEPVTLMGDISTIASITTKDYLASINCAPITALVQIDQECFQGCPALLHAILSFAPDGHILEWAFKNCSELLDVTFHAGHSPTSIYASAFEGCQSLIHFGIAHYDDIVPFSDRKEFDNDNVVFVGSQAFSGCVSLGSIPPFPNVTTIDARAFEDCTSLIAVDNIGEALTELGEKAFTGCDTLESVRMKCATPPPQPAPSFDQSTYDSAYLYVPANALDAYRAADGWKNFFKILPHGLTFELVNAASIEIEGNVGFVEAEGDWTIDWGDGSKVEVLNGDAYIPSHYYDSSASTRYVTLSGNISQIRSVKETAPFLAEVGATAHNHIRRFFASHDIGLTAIGARTFFGCSELREVLIAGSTVETLGQYAFYGCGALSSSSIYGLDNITIVAPYAFAGCSSLISLDFLPYITEIGNGGFAGCTLLETAETLPLENIAPYSFTYCTSLLRTPDCASNAGDDSDSGSDAATDGSSETPYAITIGDAAFMGCTSLTQLGTMDAVVEIGASAFSGCSALADLSGLAPNRKGSAAVTALGEEAFKGCTSLESVAIFANVTSVGNGAFRDCASLTTLEGLLNVTSIGDYAFAGCSGLESISDLGAGIVTIGDFAFLGVGENSATFPEIRMKAVTPPVIGAHTFASMDKTAVKVYVPLAAVASYRNAMLWGGNPVNYWSEFASIDAAQTVRFYLSGIPDSGLAVSGRNSVVIVQPLTITSTVYDAATGQTLEIMNDYSQWFVDWGDGSPVEAYDASTTALPGHRYSGEFTEAVITISGNVMELGAVSPDKPIIFDENATAEEGEVVEFPYLVRVEMSNDVPLAAIGGECFINCTGLSDLKLPQRVFSADEEFAVGDEAFGNTGLTSLEFIPQGYPIAFGDGVFKGCKKLTSLKGWPAQLTYIPPYTFYGCSSLAELHIGKEADIENLEAIGEFAFAAPSAVSGEYGSSILFATIGESIEEIPEIDATSFASKDGVAVKLPSLLEVPDDQVEAYARSDWNNAFTMVQNLGKVRFTLSGMDASKGTTIIHQANSSPAAACIIDWGDGQRTYGLLNGTRTAHDYNVESAVVTIMAGAITPSGALESSSEKYGWGYVKVTDVKVGDEVIYQKFTDVGGGEYLTAVEFDDDSWTGIGEGYFQGCSKLASVNAGESVTSIGVSAFKGCSSLSSLSGFSEVVELGESAFRRCTALQSPSAFTAVTVIPEYCFAGCTGLTLLDGLGKVTTIGDYAFLGCVNLEDSSGLSSELSSIGEYAFAGEKINGISAIAFAGPQLTIQADTPPDIKMSSFGKKYRYQKPTLIVPTATVQSYQNTNWGLIFEHISNGLQPSTVPRAVFEVNIATAGTTATLEGNHNAIDSWGDGSQESTRTHTYQNAGVYFVTVKQKNANEAALSSALTFSDDDSTYVLRIDSGCPFTSIAANCFENNDCLTAIYIVDKVTSIGASAFSGCSALATCKLPIGLTSIGGNAFNACTALSSVSIPTTVTTIGNTAFGGCTALALVQLPLNDAATSQTVGLGDDNAVFKGCTGLERIEINKKVLSLGVRKLFPTLLSDNSNNVVIALPKDLDAIPQSAFSGLTKLGAIDIPTTVTSIEDNAFAGCSGLTSIDIPDAVESFGTTPFKDCTSLASITVGNNALAATLNSVFSSVVDKIVMVTLRSIEDIPDGCFSGWSKLATVQGTTKGSALIDIGNSAFADCPNLKTLEIKASTDHKPYAVDGIDLKAESIGEHAFENCTSIENITISWTALKTLGQGAFSGCSRLASVTNNNYLGTGGMAYTAKVGQDAFYGCDNLNWPDVSANFRDSNGNKLHILGQWVFGVDLDCELEELDFINGRMIDDSGKPQRIRGIAPWAFHNSNAQGQQPELATTVKAIYMGSNEPSYTRNDNHQALGDGAFKDFTKLEEVFLDDTVHPIPDNTWTVNNSPFSESNGTGTITKVSLGKDACEIAMSDLFPRSYHKLKAVDLDSKAEPSIAPSLATFAGCSEITKVGANQYVASNGLKNVFPDANVTFCRFLQSVESIADDFLENSNCTHFGMYGLFTNRLLSGLNVLKDNMTELTLYHDLTRDLQPNGCRVAARAFYGFTNLKTVHVADSEYVTEDGERKTMPTEVELGVYAFAGSGVTSIGWLKAFKYPWEQGNIGAHAFEGCTSLVDTANAKMSVIPEYCFAGCTGLKTIPNVSNVQEVKAHAFENCTSLQSFSAPKLASVKDAAFKGCSALKSLSNMTSLDEIGKEAFMDSGLTTISGHKYLGVVEDRAFAGTGCTSVFRGKLMPARLGMCVFDRAKNNTVYAPTNTFLLMGGQTQIIANELDSPFWYPSPDFKPSHITSETGRSMNVYFPSRVVSDFINTYNTTKLRKVNHPSTTIPLLWKYYFQSEPVGYPNFNGLGY